MIKKHQILIEKYMDRPLSESNKLNLGSGLDYREGWVNVDLSKDFFKVDVLSDLNNLDKQPLPFKDKYFDYVFSAHTLEHLQPKSLTMVMKELWRITKPNGIIEIRVPHFSCYNALCSFEHFSAFSIDGFSLLSDPKIYPYVQGMQMFQTPLFKIIRKKLMYQRTDDGNRWLIDKKGAYYYIAKIINFLANSNIHFCERVWCHWVGGFQEMQIILRRE